MLWGSEKGQMARFAGHNQAQISPRLQFASMRYTVPVSRKPPITSVDQPVEPRQTEHGIERPRPPDPARHIQINIGSGNQWTTRPEQANIGDQFFMRHHEFRRDPRLIQRSNFESVPSECSCPILHPTRAETALPIVEDHATNRASSQKLDRSAGFGAQWHTHNLCPRITVTADPSARNAGWRPQL
jgi:hypothetical protein